MGSSGFWYVIGLVVVGGFVGKAAERWRRDTVKMTVEEIRPEIRTSQAAIAETRPLDERTLAEIRQVVRTMVREEMLSFVEEWQRAYGQESPWVK